MRCDRGLEGQKAYRKVHNEANICSTRSVALLHDEFGVQAVIAHYEEELRQQAF